MSSASPDRESWQRELQNHHIDRYLAADTDDQYRIKFVPYEKGNDLSQTACWLPLVAGNNASSAVPCTSHNLGPYQKREPILHVLTFGEGIERRLKPEYQQEMATYAKSYYEHEMGHAFHTEPRRDVVQQQLTKHKVPFKVYNVFEDARIEAARRNDLLRQGESYRFKWDTYEKPNDLNDPGQVYWAFIFHEGQRDKIDARAPTDLSKSMVDSVEGFYRRTVAAKDSLAVIEIAAEFIKEHGQTSTPGRGGNQADGENGESPTQPKSFQSKFDIGQDIEQGARDAQTKPAPGSPKENTDTNPGSSPSPHQSYGDMAAAAAALDDSEKLKDLLGKPKQSPGGITPGFNDFNTKALQANHFLAESPTDVLQEGTIGRLRKILGQSLPMGNDTYHSEKVAKTFSRDRFIRDRDDFFIHTEESRQAPTKLALIADCSSSMSGEAINQAKHLIAALSDLSKEGRLRTTVYLSGVYSGQPEFMKLDLPANRETIARIQARGGGEGLQPTITRNKDQLAKSDFMMIYTDGQISDSGINREWLKKTGKTVFGAFVGSEESAKQLNQHFDVAISGETEEQLAHRIAKTIFAKKTI